MFKPGKKHIISVIFPDDAPQEVLDLLHKMWTEKGLEEGERNIGRLLVKAMSEDMFSTTEIAKLRGITR